MTVPEDSTPATGEDVTEVPDTAGEAAPAPARRWGLRRRTPPAGDETQIIERPPDPDQDTGIIPAPPEAAPPPTRSGTSLRRERRSLMARREEMLFHLGGLAFELYRHGRLGEDVARHRAGMVAELDEAVRAIDAQLIAARTAAAPPVTTGPVEAGACMSCRAPFYDDARFCMQCGSRLVPPAPAGADDSATQVIAGLGAGES
ncbi:MAG: zinc ribbon domain-containing protein [Thermoleophilia bacterium]